MLPSCGIFNQYYTLGLHKPYLQENHSYKTLRFEFSAKRKKKRFKYIEIVHAPLHKNTLIKIREQWH